MHSNCAFYHSLLCLEHHFEQEENYGNAEQA